MLINFAYSRAKQIWLPRGADSSVAGDRKHFDGTNAPILRGLH